MIRKIKKVIQKGVARTRVALGSQNPLPDAENDFHDIYKRCRPYTMTSPERMYAMYKAVHYVVQNDIPGALVECGVYKGGSSMVGALTLKALQAENRELYLYDTFQGMSKPGANDQSEAYDCTLSEWERMQTPGGNKWCYAGLEEVQRNMDSTGYPRNLIRFIKGRVEDTIPECLPEKIALLRLDTDWYESTYHEMKHLYPRLSRNGVLIIDDYGYWKGAREAVDLYFRENHVNIFLGRIDDTGRIGLKTAP